MNFTYIDGEYTAQPEPCIKKAAANHAAYLIWVEAKNQARVDGAFKDWQHFNRTVSALCKSHPTLNCEAL